MLVSMKLTSREQQIVALLRRDPLIASAAIAAVEGPNKSLTAVTYVGPAGLEPTTPAV